MATYYMSPKIVGSVPGTDPTSHLGRRVGSPALPEKGMTASVAAYVSSGLQQALYGCVEICEVGCAQAGGIVPAFGRGIIQVIPLCDVVEGMPLALIRVRYFIEEIG